MYGLYLAYALPVLFVAKTEQGALRWNDDVGNVPSDDPSALLARSSTRLDRARAACAARRCSPPFRRSTPAAPRDRTEPSPQVGARRTACCERRTNVRRRAPAVVLARGRAMGLTLSWGPRLQISYRSTAHRVRPPGKCGRRFQTSCCRHPGCTGCRPCPNTPQSRSSRHSDSSASPLVAVGGPWPVPPRQRPAVALTSATTRSPSESGTAAVPMRPRSLLASAR